MRTKAATKATRLRLRIVGVGLRPGRDDRGAAERVRAGRPRPAPRGRARGARPLDVGAREGARGGEEAPGPRPNPPIYPRRRRRRSPPRLSPRPSTARRCTSAPPPNPSPREARARPAARHARAGRSRSSLRRRAGGRGDALRRVPGGRGSAGPTRPPRGGEARRRDGGGAPARLASRPAALGPGLAAAAASALDALARQPGARARIVGSSAWTAAACRLSSGGAAAPGEERGRAPRRGADGPPEASREGPSRRWGASRAGRDGPPRRGSGGVRETGAARDDHKNDDARDDAESRRRRFLGGFRGVGGSGRVSSARALWRSRRTRRRRTSPRARSIASRASRRARPATALALLRARPRVARQRVGGRGARHGTRGERLRGR